MVVGQATNNGNPKSASGGRHINRTLGEENRLELLVRRCARGAQDQQRRGKSFMVVGQATNNGGLFGDENHTWLLVRQTTTKIQSPTPAGGILIDHWARKIIHSCWSGDPPEADKLRQRRTSPTTAERRTSYARGGRVPTTAEIFLSLITIKNIGAQYA